MRGNHLHYFYDAQDAKIDSSNLNKNTASFSFELPQAGSRDPMTFQKVQIFDHSSFLQAVGGYGCVIGFICGVISTVMLEHSFSKKLNSDLAEGDHCTDDHEIKECLSYKSIHDVERRLAILEAENHAMLSA